MEERNALQSSRFNECLRALKSRKTEAGTGGQESGGINAEGGYPSEAAATKSSSDGKRGSELKMASSSDILSLINTLFSVKSLKGGGASGAFSGVHEGSRGDRVRALQQTLIKWMPEWKGLLQVDGIYGPQTNKALEIFKRVNGFGKDGSSMDETSAAALAGISRGDVLSHVSDEGSTGTQKLRDELSMMEGCHGTELHGPSDYSKAQERIAGIAERSPRSIVNYQNHSLQAATALKFIELEQEIARRFSGMRLLITSTMDGLHQDPGHPAGISVDFVITGSRSQPVEVSPRQSQDVEKVCNESGFSTYNEYIRDSRYKTGPHMHVSYRDRSLSCRR